MSTGVDKYNDGWTVEKGTGLCHSFVYVESAAKGNLAFDKAGALNFAAAILAEAGEPELAKMVRDKVKT